MQLNGIQDLITWLSQIFQQILNYIDHVYIFGSFSFLDFIIACLVIDIVITAFFVTFNVGFSSDRVEYTDKQGNRKTKVQRRSSSSAHVGR